MRGLFQKDLYMLTEMKKMAGTVLLIALLLLITNSGGEGFVVSYVTFIGAFMVLSTISQDDNGKGMAYLLTMPVSRKSYVQEKYLLGLAVGLACWLLSSCAAFIVAGVRRGQISMEFAGECMIYLPILLATLALMIPIQLKYGGERGRIAVIVAVAAALLVGISVAKLFQRLRLDVRGAAQLIYSYRYTCYVLCLAVFAGILWLSYRVSVRVMKSKEF